MMGARGKKRRRKDGTVASGKLAVPGSSVPRHYPLGAVQVAALAEALNVENRFFTLDDATYRERRKQDDEDDLAITGVSQDLVERIADHYDVGLDDLNIRCDKLAVLLRSSEKGQFYTIDADGSVAVDPALLEYAATVPTTPYVADVFTWPQNVEASPELTE